MSAVTDQTEVPEAGQTQTTGDLDDDDGGGLVSTCLHLPSITSKSGYISWIYRENSSNLFYMMYIVTA